MRLTVTDLLALISNDLPDNTAQLITPALVRGVVRSIAESITPVTSLIGGSPFAAVSMVLSTTPTKLPTGIFSVAVNGNSTLMEARLAQEDILLKTTIGRAFLSFNVTFAAGNGVDVAFTMSRNGSPLVFRSVQTGRGLTNQISVEFTWIFETLVIGDFVEVFANSLTGTPSINIHNAALKAILLPQYV